MTNETLYTIGELADAAGVTTRTIRYYTAEGLLPPPETRGRYALYSADHLRRLHMIARLKDAYLPLGEIKARIEQLSAEDVRELLAEYRRPPQAPPASATDYIAQVLAAPIAPAEPRMLTESAPGYAASGDRGAAEQRSAGAIPIGFAAALPAPPAAPSSPHSGAAPPAGAPAPGGLLRKLVPQRRERGSTPYAAEAAPEETWQRVTLAPGVELHIREPLAAEVRTRVERLIVRARELFGE
jgi:DNA-binding transcriptional MerR regulator